MMEGAECDNRFLFKLQVRPFFVIIFAKALVVAIELCYRSSCDSLFERFALSGHVISVLMLSFPVFTSVCAAVS